MRAVCEQQTTELNGERGQRRLRKAAETATATATTTTTTLTTTQKYAV